MKGWSAFMDDREGPESNARRQAMLARAREQMRAADRADTYLFLQQTIQADLAVQGELGPDEYVELVRADDGAILARKVSAIEQAPQAEEDAPVYRSALAKQTRAAMVSGAPRPSMNEMQKPEIH
jgi:hypothetical protein